MTQRSNGLFAGLLFLLAFLLLVALNPTRDDFIAWRSASQAAAASRNAPTGVMSALGKGLGGAVGSLSGGSYRRNNLAFCSTFTSPDRKTVYLGIAKLFIRLK